MAAYISILLPTRERPEQLLRFLNSLAENTAEKKNFEVVLYIDDDDSSYNEILMPDLNIVKIIGCKLPMGGYNTACLTKARGDIVVLLNDDVVVRTKGWDMLVRAVHTRFPDGIYLAYGNDLYKGNKIATFPILSRRFCNVAIKPFPEEYVGSLIDYHLFDIFKRLEKRDYNRIFYLNNLIFEHMHFRSGKANFDATYQRRNRFEDDKTFLMLSGYRELQAERLLCAMEGHPFHHNRMPYKHQYKNKNLFEAILSLFQLLVFDKRLPLSWRSFLFCWFTARTIAYFGYLKIFGLDSA